MCFPCSTSLTPGGTLFEETIYVTPSRLPDETQKVVSDAVQRASTAVGLTEGPVHAELRVHHGEARIIEIAGRSIGGSARASWSTDWGCPWRNSSCATPWGKTWTVSGAGRAGGAAGVMMLPVPEGGMFQGFDGVWEAKQVPGVEDVVITAKEGDMLTPLPEGASYPGFIFARGMNQARSHGSFEKPMESFECASRRSWPRSRAEHVAVLAT